MKGRSFIFTAVLVGVMLSIAIHSQVIAEDQVVKVPSDTIAEALFEFVAISTDCVTVAVGEDIPLPMHRVAIADDHVSADS